MVVLRLVSVRLNGGLVDRLKELASEFNTTFSDLLRLTLNRGLESILNGCDGRARELLTDLLLKRYVGDLKGMVKLQVELLKSGPFLGKSLPKDMDRLQCYLKGVDDPCEWEALMRLMSERERKAKLLAELINDSLPEPEYVLINERNKPRLKEIVQLPDGCFKCPACDFKARLRRDIVRHAFIQHR
ncbi:MAG: hypothetical protein QXK12_04320 [Candidatus Nezhaarchaeales archaeon]